ncbi:hypothetical protein ACSSS7_006116 [Eimeria intestinalis]
MSAEERVARDRSASPPRTHLSSVSHFFDLGPSRGPAFPLHRVPFEPARPPSSGPLQGRRGILNCLPRLDTVPRNYADLRSFLLAIELALHALGCPSDAFHITTQRLHPRLQTHIRKCMATLLKPARTSYDHMVSILIQQVAPGKPEDYLYQTVASISRRSHTQIFHLHMQITGAYCGLYARLRSDPHLSEYYVVTGFLANLPQVIARDTRNGERPRIVAALRRLQLVPPANSLAWSRSNSNRARDDCKPCPRYFQAAPDATGTAAINHLQQQQPQSQPLSRSGPLGLTPAS